MEFRELFAATGFRPKENSIDILSKRYQQADILLIECQTHSKEFDKKFVRMKKTADNCYIFQIQQQSRYDYGF